MFGLRVPRVGRARREERKRRREGQSLNIARDYFLFCSDSSKTKINKRRYSPIW